MSATYGTVCGALSRASQYYALDGKGRLKREGRYQVLYGVRRALGALGISPLRCELNAMGACFERTRQHLGAHSLLFNPTTRRLYQQITNPDQLATRLGYQVFHEAFQASGDIIHYIATHIDQWANLYPALRNLENARMIARLNGDLLAYILPHEVQIRRDREVIAAALKKDIGYWRCLDPIDRNDLEFIAFALNLNGRLLSMLPRLQNSIQMILIALNQTPHAWKSVASEIKQQPGMLFYHIIQDAEAHPQIFKNLPLDIVLSPLFKHMILHSEHWMRFAKVAFSNYPQLWTYYEPDMGASLHEVARQCFESTPRLYHFFSKRVQADPVILLRFLSVAPNQWLQLMTIAELLKWLTEEQLLAIFDEIIRADRSVFEHMKEEQLNFYYARQPHAWMIVPVYWKNAFLAKKILRLNGQALSVVEADTPELFFRNKIDFYLAALINQPQLWTQLDSDLTEDPLFQVEALAVNGKIMEWLPGSTSSYVEALKAMGSNSDCWHLVDRQLKKNPQFIHSALKVNSWVGARLSVEEAMLVCRSFPSSYRMLSQKLQIQPEIYSFLVSLEPAALLVLDLPLFLQIFKKDPQLFDSLPPSFLAHRKYQLAQVMVQPQRIQSIDALDLEEVLTLIKANPKVFRYVPKQFHDHPLVRKAAVAADPYNFMDVASAYITEPCLWEILMQQQSHAFALISARMACFTARQEGWYLPIFERNPQLLSEWMEGFSVYYESVKKIFFVSTPSIPRPSLGRWVLLHSKNAETALPAEPRLQNSLLLMILKQPDFLQKVPIKFFQDSRFLELLMTLMPDLASYFVRRVPQWIKPLLIITPKIRAYYFDGLDEREVLNYLKLYPQDYCYLRGTLRESISIATHVIDSHPGYYLDLPDCVKSNISIIKKVAASSKIGFVLVCQHARKNGTLHEMMQQVIELNPTCILDLIRGWTLYKVSRTSNFVVQSFSERCPEAVLIDSQPPMIPSVDSAEILNQYVEWIGIALTADGAIYADIPDFFRYHRDFVRRWLRLNPRLIRVIYKYRPRLAIQMALASSQLQTYLYGQIVIGGRLYLPVKLKDEYRLQIVQLPDADRLDGVLTATDQLAASIAMKLETMTAEQKREAAEDKSGFLQTELAEQTEALKTALRASYLPRLYDKIKEMIEGWERDWHRMEEREQHRLISMLHTELQVPSEYDPAAPSSDLDALMADAIATIKDHLLAGFHARLFNPSPGVGTPDPINTPGEYGAFWKQIYLHLAHANRAWEQTREPSIGIQLLYSQRYCPSNLQSQVHQIFMQFAVQSSLDPGLTKLAEVFSHRAQDAIESVLLSFFPASQTVRDPHHVNAIWHRFQEFTDQPLVVGDCHQEHYAHLFNSKMVDERFYFAYDLNRVAREVVALYQNNEALKRFLDQYYADFVAEAWTAEDLAACQPEIDEAVLERWRLKLTRIKELIQLAAAPSLTTQQRLKYMALGGKVAFDALSEPLRQLTCEQAREEVIQEEKAAWISRHREQIAEEVVSSKMALKKMIPIDSTGKICGSTIFKILEHLGFLHSERY